MSNYSRKFRRNKSSLPKIRPVSELPDDPVLQKHFQALADNLSKATNGLFQATHFSMPESMK